MAKCKALVITAELPAKYPWLNLIKYGIYCSGNYFLFVVVVKVHRDERVVIKDPIPQEIVTLMSSLSSLLFMSWGRNIFNILENDSQQRHLPGNRDM